MFFLSGTLHPGSISMSILYSCTVIGARCLLISLLLLL